MTSIASDLDIFDLAPIAMWIEDFSAVAAQFSDWRRAGITDIRSFLNEDVNRVAACSQRIRILRVNQKTLDLFEADSQEHLTENLSSIFRDEMLQSHVNELASLWDGSLEFDGSAVNYTFGSPPRHTAARARPARP
jgi:hypothetical protein